MASSLAIRQALNAYFCVGVWMTVSIGVILFNKWLLAFAGFPFPITLTLWHMVFCSAAGFLCVRVLRTSKSFNMNVEDYVTRVLPIGARLWSARCAFGNSALHAPHARSSDYRYVPGRAHRLSAAQ
jgi:hypothetical protein